MNNFVRLMFAIFFPPLAVIDRGMGKFAITLILWMTTGIGGIVAALYFGFSERHRHGKHGYSARRRHYTYSPAERRYYSQDDDDNLDDYAPPAQKRKPRLHTPDGEILEIVDPNEDDYSLPNRHQYR